MIDDSEYAKAAIHWLALWNSMPESDRADFGWRAPWFENSRSERDGNPIFSAISERERKGIRVIQYEPSCTDLEFDYWFDTFGGDAAEPAAIRELVFACALSDEASSLARGLIRKWIVGPIG